jgi:O-antigen/teichoic acid export membrane protein
MYHKKNWIFSSGGILQGSLNLLLNLLFIPVFGYVFAAYSTVVSVLFFTLWIIYWSFKIDSLQLNTTKYIIILILFSTASLIFNFLNIETLLYKIVFLIPILIITYKYYPVKQLIN